MLGVLLETTDSEILSLSRLREPHSLVESADEYKLEAGGLDSGGDLTRSQT